MAMPNNFVLMRHGESEANVMQRLDKHGLHESVNPEKSIYGQIGSRDCHWMALIMHVLLAVGLSKSLVASKTLIYSSYRPFTGRVKQRSMSPIQI